MTEPIPFTAPGEREQNRSAPVSPLTTEVDRLTEEFRQRMTVVAAAAENALRQAITDRLSEEFDGKLETAIRMIREEMEQRLEAARAKWEDERRQLKLENEDLRQLGDIDRLRVEIKATEDALAKVAVDVAAMVENPNVRLSEVMRKNSEQAELRAYLRGLHFRSSATQV